MRDFPTYWNTSIQTYTDGRPGTSCQSGATTLQEALQQAITDASYYRLVCGYDVTIRAWKACARCHNQGTILKRTTRTAKQIRCPDCRGKCPNESIGPFPFRLHPNVVDSLAAV